MANTGSDSVRLYPRSQPRREALARHFARRHLGRMSQTFAAQREQRMAVYAHDAIGVEVFTTGLYEKDHLDVLIRLLSPLGWWEEKGESAVLDIGANIGNHSLYFADYFGQVLAFEPNPRTFRLLQFNTELTSNIAAFNFGLGERAETLELHWSNLNVGGASTVHVDGKAASATVNVARLDDVDIDLSRVALMKIDVEGMECAVLSGGSRLINSVHPIIVFEQHAEDFDEQGSTPSIRLLREFGYRFCRIEIGGEYRIAWLARRMKNVAELVVGKKISRRVVFGDEIPTGFYHMIVAIPPQHYDALRGGG